MNEKLLFALDIIRKTTKGIDLERENNGRAIGVRWFTLVGRSSGMNDACIGIIITYDEQNLGEKYRAFIGAANGKDEEDDVRHIAAWGNSFPLHIAYELIFGDVAGTSPEKDTII